MMRGENKKSIARHAGINLINHSIIHGAGTLACLLECAVNIFKFAFMARTHRDHGDSKKASSWWDEVSVAAEIVTIMRIHRARITHQISLGFLQAIEFRT